MMHFSIRRPCADEGREGQVCKVGGGREKRWSDLQLWAWSLCEDRSGQSCTFMAVELEVCVDSVASAVAAAEAGATRLELCAGLALGGVTPTIGTFVAVRQRCPALPVMVLVRPRAGDFCFSPEEVEAMETDIRLFRQHGASGFVLGALTRDGDVDVPTCRRLLAAAGPDADTTFHRAFDVARAPEAALERVVELGFRRLLTSGQAASVEQGMELIGRLERQAAGRIQLMPGGGVSESNVARLLQVTQVRAVHASASKPVPLPDAAVSFGEHRICSSERVRALLSIIRAQQPL
ncbi:PF03932 family protein CutC isoform X3 [Haemaphysalis longicornis]